MKCILLAAGYATRLYPLTKDKPKSLLEVSGKTILQHILDKVEVIEGINDVYIVTNDRFYNQFNDWVNQYPTNKVVKVINDGTTTNDNRLGAIADIQYVVDKESIEEDVLVLAGDNLFDFDLRDFVNFYKDVNNDCISVLEVSNVEDLKRTGVVEIDENGIAIGFEEKPQEPKSNLAVPPFYLYTKDTVNRIKEYLNEGNNPDAPGNFVPWLIGKKDVYAYKLQGKRYDIGTLESYEKVQDIFK
ncbi:glucose-1-phosphate thymidylyltransferase [Natranaerovirga pectinivora]|uniref:Glucose-1-phosphate thymidylyltransferase n=1 Tax=Natranaerovirga pectinivora TaxID=682400 RepID=A0A4R3MG38_9FIRM|nr:nucleotidyltransferase family protein [Natranaerovirga pectinivora]TCT12848.1 glucose-1-phosphate thymidylyltransferase [Natranaerovirga pectinivora]